MARLLVILLLAAALRLFLTLTHPNYLGVDGGAYLLSVMQVTGHDVSAAQSFARPPLAPGWLLFPFVHFAGPDIGYKIFQAIASLAPIPVVYLIARKWLSVPAALVAASFASVDLLHAEMLVTGALPLIGFALLGLLMWAMSEATFPNINSKWYPLVIVALIPLIAITNQTTAGIALIALPVFGLSLALFDPASYIPRHYRLGFAPLTLIPIWIPAVIGGAIAAWIALPYYLDLTPGAGALRYPGPLLILPHWLNPGYYTAAFPFAAGIGTVWLAKDYRLRSLGAVTIVLSIVSLFFSYDESIMNITFRSRYFIWLLFWPQAVWLACHLWGTAGNFLTDRYAAFLASGLLFMGFAIGYVDQFQDQTGYSDQITADTAILLEDIRPTHSGLIVNTFSMALWAAALNRVPVAHTWNTKPPAQWVTTDYLVRCVLGWAGCDPYYGELAAHLLEIEYVLIDERFPSVNNTSVYGSPGEPWASMPPWLTQLERRGSSVLYQVTSVREWENQPIRSQ